VARSAIGTIINDDPGTGMRVGIGDTAVLEGNSGAHTAPVPISLSSAPGTATVTVPYTVTATSATPATAISTNDYKAVSGTLKFTGATILKAIPVKVYGDRFVESDETLQITLGSALGAAVARRTGTVTILNDDTTAPPSGGATVLWSAGMESASLSEWTSGGGGGMENSGAAAAAATSTVARSGAWALKATIDTSAGSAGVRAFRWTEPRKNRDAYYSVWLYLPTNYRLSGSEQWWNLFQFKSRTADGSRIDPVWAIYATQDSNGLYLHAGWGWGNTSLAGPRAGDGVSGKWYAPASKVYLQAGRWIHLEAFLRQSKDFDGVFQFWQDDTLLFDFQNVRTSYKNCNFNSWCADNEWSVNVYADALSPNPTTTYFDDASISR
jgi:hypothetical protein